MRGWHLACHYTLPRSRETTDGRPVPARRPPQRGPSPKRIVKGLPAHDSPVQHRRREVLKFMGDAVLAFFHRDDPAQACRAALQAALAALDRLDRLAEPDATLRAGVALHYGKVSYGNIGSGRR